MDINYLHGMGSHLLLDCYGCKNMNNAETINKVLAEVPKQLGMHPISEPIVIKSKHNKKSEQGYTGFVILEESHLSIHTYPAKDYCAIDIFVCKEFDINRAVTLLKDAFKFREVTKQVMQRGIYRELNEKDFNKIKGTFPEGKASDLLESYRFLGFQATNVAKSMDIIRKMKKKKSKIFLSFTSNMVSSGLREIFAFLVQNKLIDAIITSVGSIEEDLMKCRKPFLLGNFDVDDQELHRLGVNRIGNVFVPNHHYEKLEDTLIPFFKKMHEVQKKTNKLISPSELIFELGKIVDDKSSILYWATKNNIPIFCPGITDGALGLQLYFFKQKYKDFGIDVSADMNNLANLVLNSDSTAGIILGGGIAKHHLIGVNILRGGLDYAVYITTATESDGSLSGARPREAISWSKLQEDSNHVCVEADATLVFPLLAMAMKEEFT